MYNHYKMYTIQKLLLGLHITRRIAGVTIAKVTIATLIELRHDNDFERLRRGIHI